MDKYYFGIDVGGTSVKMGLFSDSGEVKEKWSIPTNTDDEGKSILPDIAAQIEKKINQKKGEVLGIGIGIPGPITEDGTVMKCANINWPIFNVKEKMQELTGVKNVAVGNDANVAALGEMWKGGGKGFDSIVMVTLGTGIGGGIIQDGKILVGSTGAGGEIGHIKVEPNETDVCGCGCRGCIEQYASATGIGRMARKELRKDSPLARRDYISAKAVFDEAKKGDDYAMYIVDKFARYLGMALSSVASVVNPQAFVIGGGVAKAGNIILNKVVPCFKDNALFALKDTEFRLAKLGNDAGIYGAVKMVIKED